MSSWRSAFLIAAAVFLGAQSARANIDRLVPASATAGGPAFTLHIISNSGGFDETDQFTWNGIPLNTILITGNEVQATIPASFLTVAGTVTVADVGFNAATFTVNPPVLIATSVLPPGTQGTPYLFTLTATGGTPPYTWSVLEGPLPAGLTLNPATGVISGTPTAEGSVTMRFQALDTAGGVDRKGNLIFLILPVPTVLTITTPSVLPPATAGVPYSQPLTAAGGAPPYTWSITAGSLPAGATLSAAGVLSGQAAASGSFQFTARVADSAGATATKVLLLPVGAAPVPSCTIAPQNSALPLHRPELHTTGGHADHIVTVRVTAGTAAAPAIPISVTATRIVFAASGSAATQNRATAATDANGEARFIVNPPAATAFDSTQLTVTGTINSQSFTCTGTLLVGVGALSSAIERQSQPARLAFGQILEKQFALDYDRFAAEIGAVVTQHPELRPVAERLLDRFQPILARALSGRPVRIGAAEIRQIDSVLRSISDDASPELRATLTRWRRDLAAAHLRARAPALRGPEAVPGDRAAIAAAGAAAALGKLRLSFETNQGQAPAAIRYIARGALRSVYFTDSGVAFPVGSRESGRQVRMQLTGAARWNTPVLDEPLAARSHYLIGTEPRQWRTGVPQHGRLRYKDVYPGTDLVFYGDQGRLRYDFILAPGADARKIKLRFQGVESTELASSGELILHDRSGNLRLEKPFVYQESALGRTAVDARYVNAGKDAIAFALGPYDRTRALVIDPVLVYSSYLGGSSDDAGLAIAVDSQGSAYITGTTTSSTFPGTRNQSPRNVESFVTKLTPDGTGIVYSTYVGGNGSDIATGIAVDAGGNAYVCGSTTSTDFPVVQPIQRTLADRNALLGGDAFVLKLNPTGSAMIYSTYIGGAGLDIAKSIALDSSGNAYVGGFTASPDFPLKGALQTTLRGGKPLGTDAFLLKVAGAGTSLVYSTFLGGAGDELGNAVAVDAAGNAYLSGVTYSSDFPFLNGLQTSTGGAADAFVTKVNPTGSAIVYSTYLGGESDDIGLAIAVDAAGSAYVAGMTGSAKFPLAGPAQPKPGSPDQAGFDGFVSKLSPDGKSLIYSTFIGGAGTDVAQGIALGSDNSVYLAGETDSPVLPASSPVSPGGGSSDGFVAKLNPAGSLFEYVTRMGGSGLDTTAAIALDKSGNVYLAGSSLSQDHAVTYGVYQAAPAGLSDAVVFKLAAGTPPGFLSLTSAAALAAGQPGAPQAIVSAFGESLAPRIEVAPRVLPLDLAGVSVAVKDSAGATRAAPLYFVAPGQINFVVPKGASTGLAEITVLAGAQVKARETLLIEPVAPGLFAANSSGKGPAAAIALQVSAGGAQTSQLTFTCGAAPGSCVNQPVDLAGSDARYLLLFGTGFRGRTSLAGVTATIGGIPVTVAYAGDQGEFEGFDQLNLGPLPASLAGKASVDIVVTADGKRANIVTVSFR